MIKFCSDICCQISIIWAFGNTAPLPLETAHAGPPSQSQVYIPELYEAVAQVSPWVDVGNMRTSKMCSFFKIEI